MNQIFQLNRFMNVIRLRWIMHRKVWFIQAGAFTGIAFIITGLIFADSGQNNNREMFQAIYQLFYFMLLVLTGIYLASRSFAEYKDTSSAFSYMILPASTFEKFLIPAFFSGIFYFIAFTLFYTLLAWLTNIFWSLIYHYELFWFHPLDPQIEVPFQFIFIIFMVLQPLFLFGSIALRKHQFIITGLTLFTFLIACILISLLLNRIVHGSDARFQLPLNEIVLHKAFTYVVTCIVHIILLVAVFFKLKEKEV